MFVYFHKILLAHKSAEAVTEIVQSFRATFEFSRSRIGVMRSGHIQCTHTHTNAQRRRIGEIQILFRGEGAIQFAGGELKFERNRQPGRRKSEN